MLFVKTRSKLMRMQFLLPSKYTMENAPKPSNENVKLVQIEERDLAVITFSGTCDQKMAVGKLKELLDFLKADKFQVDESKWRLYRYNPPWTLPNMKTNEVVVPVVNFEADLPKEA